MKNVYIFSHEGLEYEVNIEKIEYIAKTFDKSGIIKKIHIRLVSGFEFSIVEMPEIDAFLKVYDLV